MLKTFDNLKAFEAAQTEKAAPDLDKNDGQGAWARSLPIRQTYRAWIEAELSRVSQDDLRVVSAMIMGEMMANYLGKLLEDGADDNEALQVLVFNATTMVAHRFEDGGPDLPTS